MNNPDILVKKIKFEKIYKLVSERLKQVNVELSLDDKRTYSIWYDFDGYYYLYVGHDRNAFYFLNFTYFFNTFMTGIEFYKFSNLFYNETLDKCSNRVHSESVYFLPENKDSWKISIPASLHLSDLQDEFYNNPRYKELF